jgi:endo-1,3-1,4-beta-glycanase ExoK
MTSLGRAAALSALLLSAACDVGSSSVAKPETTGSSDPKGTFTLLYRDDFEQLDLTRWQIMTHSWDSNLALFSAQAVSNADGNLVISLKPAPDGTVDDQGAAKRFFGAEVRSRDTLTYGKIRARAKLARGSAVVSSLVSIYTPWPADNWNELDIECLGASPSNVQFNTMVYTGAPVQKPATQSVTPTPDPHSAALGFDSSEDFHIYTIEWTPAGARFSVDDELAYTWNKHIDLMTLPQNVLLTIWASSSSAWAGAVTDDTSKAQAWYDWVELYKYSEP